MKPTSLSRPNEQRKIERLLLKLAKIKPVSAKPAPIAAEERALKRGTGATFHFTLPIRAEELKAS